VFFLFSVFLVGEKINHETHKSSSISREDDAVHRRTVECVVACAEGGEEEEEEDEDEEEDDDDWGMRIVLHPTMYQSIQ